MTNPLLSYFAMPPFSSIDVSCMEPAIKQIITENRQTIDTLLESAEAPPEWGNLIQKLDKLEDRLSNAWSAIEHLFSVNNNEEIREVYQRCQPLVTEYRTTLAQNAELYKRIHALRDRADELNLKLSQVKVLDDYLLDFQLAGVTLPESKKNRFKEIEDDLGQLSTRFSNNLLDATHAWNKQITDLEKLSGLPDIAIQTAADVATQKELDGYVLTLDAPCYIAVMTYADDEELRREIYTAFNTRASDQSGTKPEWNNDAVMQQILQLRQEQAKLLGFHKFADVSLAKKMADKPEQVMQFLNDLLEKGKPVAEAELKELREFASSENKDELNAWDVAYYSEKLRKQKFDISQEELRPYFPLNRVTQGLFKIVEILYGLEIEPNSDHEVWHPSVTAYDIRKDGDVIAHFYFDLFTRDSKRGGAWMGECRTRRQLDDGAIQLPAAYLVCNFAAGIEGNPALLAHSEVTTLFHEFGHGLHHMLSKEIELRVSGINGVAWDAVELPSQLMENWCWDKESLELISGHWESDARLPEKLLDRMLKARNFQAGMKMLRQLEFALFDFELHCRIEPYSENTVRETMSQVRDRTSVYPVPEFNRFENGFAHIFSGGYAAGYYSYYWAEVLSADVFSRFAESGVLNGSTGRQFLDKLLSRGGGAKALQLFKDFMGREPDVNALLIQKGMLTTS